MWSLAVSSRCVFKTLSKKQSRYQIFGRCGWLVFIVTYYQQGIVHGSASKPALEQDRVEKTYHIALYLGAFVRGGDNISKSKSTP